MCEDKTERGEEKREEREERREEDIYLVFRQNRTGEERRGERRYLPCV